MVSFSYLLLKIINYASFKLHFRFLSHDFCNQIQLSFSMMYCNMA